MVGRFLAIRSFASYWRSDECINGSAICFTQYENRIEGLLAFTTRRTELPKDVVLMRTFGICKSSGNCGSDGTTSASQGATKTRVRRSLFHGASPAKQGVTCQCSARNVTTAELQLPQLKPAVERAATAFDCLTCARATLKWDGD